MQQIHSALITDTEGLLKCKNTTVIHNTATSFSEHVTPTEGRTQPHGSKLPVGLGLNT